MTKISVQDFQRQMESLPQETLAIDVRSPLEHKGVAIKGVQNIPIEELEQHVQTLKKYKQVYIICASGNRSSQAQATLSRHGIQSLSVTGGMQLWEQMNLPVKRTKGVLPVIRQVFIVAGSLVLLGTVLSLVASPMFVYIAMFVGAGLLFSGVSGWCGMAKILALMPWNTVGVNTGTMQPSCSISGCTTVASTSTVLEWKEGNYTICQFTNADLAHYSYAIVSDGKMAVIDPARDPEQYYAYAQEQQATITAVFETHPHADFVSAHAEIAATTGATIFVSPLVGADYVHTPFTQGSTYTLGAVLLRGLATPGHSPDSISVLLEHNGTPVELFSGDTLFVGDVGRPDLRETVGNVTAVREQLAGMMFETVEQILKPLADTIRVFPAHGAGSLCGKALGNEPFTTIGKEKATNPAFAMQTKEEFIARLTEGQPFIPKYFAHNVQTNKQGAKPYNTSINSIPVVTSIPTDALIVDTRTLVEFNSGHRHGALHIADGMSFETWLGSIISPAEQFYLVVEDQEAKATILHKVANIGYEQNVQGVHLGVLGTATIPAFSKTDIDLDLYTILDVRNPTEIATKPIFTGSISLPLYELRERLQQLPTNKPVLVHCAGGYRSAVAVSILRSQHIESFDLSTAIHNYA